MNVNNDGFFPFRTWKVKKKRKAERKKKRHREDWLSWEGYDSSLLGTLYILICYIVRVIMWVIVQ